jgi:hypothetical protein
MVKVISFSLWGSAKKYTIGAIKNADLAKEVYPDFQCWFYIHEETVPQDIIEELSKKDNVKIIFKKGDVNTSKPMMWRFEPILDPDVELMMSRDTDTRILLREKLAVEEWMKSDKIMHIMRDHPYHAEKIQGGMYGIKKNNLLDWSILLKSFNQKGNRDYDQNFLGKYIYPIYKDHSIIHASFHKYELFAKDFPIPFDDDFQFVGQFVYEDESRGLKYSEMIKDQIK